LKDLDEDDNYTNDPKQNLRLRSRIADLAYRPQPDSGHNDPPEHGPLLSVRARLLAEIEGKLLRYDEILMKARELAEFQRPSERDWLNLRKWLYNKKPLDYEPEEMFIRMRDDLVTLRPRTDWGKIDGWIELVISRLSEWKPTRWTTTVGVFMTLKSLHVAEEVKCNTRP
jgi:hypothetical protein